MKKMVIIFLVAVMSFNVLEITQAKNLYRDSENAFDIKNIEAEEIYRELLYSKNVRVKANSDSKQISEDILTDYDFTGFEQFIDIADSEYDLEFIYTYDDENVVDVIAYDKTDDAYFLLEEDLVNCTSTITVNEETYLLNADANNIVLENQNGEKLQVYERTFKNDEEIIPNTARNITYTKAEMLLERGTTWISLGDKYIYSESNMIFDVLDVIGQVAGGFTIKCESTIIGVVLFVYSTMVSIGSRFSKTIYMKTYQYCASDCTTYIMNKSYLYGAYSDWTQTFYEPLTDEKGNQKITYSYYHSQRPDYTGNPACQAYQ